MEKRLVKVMQNVTKEYRDGSKKKEWLTAPCPKTYIYNISGTCSDWDMWNANVQEIFGS